MPRKETINPPERKLPKRLPPHAARFVYPFYLAKEDGKESAVPGMHLTHLAMIEFAAGLFANEALTDYTEAEIIRKAQKAAHIMFDILDKEDPFVTQHE